MTKEEAGMASVTGNASQSWNLNTVDLKLRQCPSHHQTCDHQLSSRDTGKSNGKSRSIVSVALFPNNDISAKIMEYLDTKSLLFGVAAVFSNDVRSQLTYHHVLRSAMRTARGYRIVRKLVSLVYKECIHIPSPMRLLQLVHGKRCEKCNRTKTNNVNDLGLFTCRSCTERMVADIDISSKVFRQSIVEDARCAKLRVSVRGGTQWKMYASKSPFVDRAGETAGPLLSLESLVGPSMRHTNLWCRDAIDVVFQSCREADPQWCLIPQFLSAYEMFKPHKKYEHRGIVNHRGPFSMKESRWMWDVEILWQNGERTWVPLREFSVDDFESCADYASANNLLDERGWKKFRRRCEW